MKKIVCNPLNLSYKFQQSTQLGVSSVFREAADPTVVNFNGRFLLFASMSKGFWYSDDLADWKYHSLNGKGLPLYGYAPDVRQIEDYLYFCASDSENPCAIYRTKDPFSDSFEKVNTLFPFHDPALFCDDDGKVYLYWGCSNKTPIYGIELDSQTFMPIGEKKELIFAEPEIHGWERIGRDNNPEDFESEETKAAVVYIGKTPFIEGPFMNKYNGKYYLQYAAPGTEYNTYGDGVYVSDKPLGEFVYVKSNPFSLKAGGFITGAGHGSTFFDNAGNLWHASTMRISCNSGFERRIGLFPAGVDGDGNLFCNQNFADYPFVVENRLRDPNNTFAGMMLLSYKKPCFVSSYQEGYPAENAVDENIRTWWAANGEKGEYLILDLQNSYNITAIQVNVATHKIEFEKNDEAIELCGGLASRYIVDSVCPLSYKVEISDDGSNWQLVHLQSEDLPHNFFLLEEKARYIKVSCIQTPYHGAFAISGLRIFGKGNGKKPPAADIVKAERINGTSALVKWAGQSMGYNIRYGIAPDKLYLSYTVYEKTALKLNGLNAGTEYYVAVDSFDENGINEGKPLKIKNDKE